MPRPKGLPKTGGKVVGSLNKTTIQWQEFGKTLFENALPRALKIMKECDDDVFMDNFNKLIEYFKPKLGRVEVNGEIDVKTVSETTIFQIKPKG